MPDLIDRVDAEGALVEVLVGWSASSVRAARTALRPIPPPVSARALIDSGAEVTCVNYPLVSTLGLALGGFTLANLPALGGVTFSAQYDAGFTIVHPSGDPRLNLFVSDLLVTELTLDTLGYQVLIGRDVLAFCEFLFDGPNQRFRLSY